MDSDLCFSYSGLKTALRYYLEKHPVADDDHGALVDIVSSYQEAIVDTLVTGAARAMRGMHTLAVGGGVSLNSRLRTRLREYADTHGVRLLLAHATFCGDNAGMIGALAAMGQGVWGEPAMACDAEPNLTITDTGA
jgi:N6-L-threonylcarbamoyladenine synthase